jgi:energy-coupling factor transport system permease protein
VNLGFYRPTGGFLELVHPSSKLICLLLAFVPPFFSRGPLQVLPYFLLLLTAALATGAMPNLRRIGVIMLILFVMSVILWSIFQPGENRLFALGPIAITREGISFGLMIGLRLNCFVLAAVIFLTSTPIEAVAHGLSRLGLPFVVSFTVSLAFRLTPLFLEAGRTIVMAQKSRGLDLASGGPIKRLRLYIPIIVPVIVSGLRKADQLAIALESKGFGGKGKRTMLLEYSVGWRDLVLVLVLLAAIAVTATVYCNAGAERLLAILSSTRS